MFEGMNGVEKFIVRKLVRKILERDPNMSISCYDEEEQTVEKSRDFNVIIDNLGNTGMDIVQVWEGEKYIHEFILIWGNGEDIISDHTDSQLANEIMEEVLYRKKQLFEDCVIAHDKAYDEYFVFADMDAAKDGIRRLMREEFECTYSKWTAEELDEAITDSVVFYAANNYLKG